MPGLEKIPIRWPDKWDPVFMDRLMREVFALADVRNAIAGDGVSISGNSDQPATIATNGDIDALIDENFVLAESSTLLANARVLDGEGSVVEVDDSGPGGIIRIRIAAHGISYSKFRFGPPCSVVGRPANSTGEQTSIAASANDTLLRRVGDVLGFGQLAAGMAPDALWTNAKLADMAESTIKGRAAGGGTGVPQDLDATQVKAILAIVFADIGGDIDDGQVPESAVTQHETALAIAFSQLTAPAQVPGGLSDYADDTAAAVGGIAINGLYRTGSVVKIRVS
jgi:hypothetical protein